MTNRQTEADYADRVIQAAMTAATGGLDADRVAEVVAKVVEAIDKQAAALKAATYRPEDYERIARAMAHAMKSADGLYRLVEFASGRPDSRPDKATDWLRGLTDEQLRIVQGWVEASGEATAPPRPHGAQDAVPEPHSRRSAT
jgi:uncharacterized membrane protein YebE (DUF533 family)